MAQLGRPGLSPRQKNGHLWSMWRRGQSLSDIGRALGKHAGSIYGVLASSGGITPARRTRSEHRTVASGARGDFAPAGEGLEHSGDSQAASSFALNREQRDLAKPVVAAGI